jgi:hypothetical protein
MVRVGVANRTITPPCPHGHTLIFCDFQIFFVSAFYEASALLAGWFILLKFWASFNTPVTVQLFGMHGKMLSEKRDFRVKPTYSYGLFLDIFFYKMFYANMFLFSSVF